MRLFKFKKAPEDLSRSEWENLIRERILGRNALRDRDILTENLLNGRTYSWIAEKWGMSERQIARIVPQRLKQMFKSV